MGGKETGEYVRHLPYKRGAVLTIALLKLRCRLGRAGRLRYSFDARRHLRVRIEV